MTPAQASMLSVSSLFAEATQEIIEKFCKIEVKVGKNAQFLSTVQISEDIGAFASFHGNYSGLMVLNFEGEAALELVASSMRSMGMPESEVPSHYMADDVRGTIGELVNNIIGDARVKIQNKFDLSATATIPAVLPIATPIGLVFKSSSTDGNVCIRLVFTTPESHRFHLELNMEGSQIVALPTS